MKHIIAIPAAGGKLCTHFGHCTEFEVFDTEDGKITSSRSLSPPEHRHGAYPRFLEGLGVGTVIAGGMGAGARTAFGETGIKLVLGQEELATEDLVNRFLAGGLVAGPGECGGHGHDSDHECTH